MRRRGEAMMKKKLILAALLMSMAVTVFAEEQIVWEDQTAAEDPAFVFEEEDTSEQQMVSEEQTASEEPEYVFEEPAATIEEQITDTDTVFEEIAFDEGTDLIQEPSVFEEQVTEDLVSEDLASEQASAVDIPHAVEGLVYTGEPQVLILPQPGSWLYSLDGEQYKPDPPTAINAGTYTVYMKEGNADPVAVTVTIAKADVIFTPPVANSTIIATASEAGEEPAGTGEEPSYAAGEENEVGEGVAEPAYSGEEPAYADEVVFEVVFE